MSFDPRFTCPDCGRAPVLTDAAWKVISEKRRGVLVPGQPVTCYQGHTWTPPVDWTPPQRMKVFYDVAGA